MREPSHTDPNNRIDHPLDHSERHAWDVYLNPWWAKRFLNGPAEVLSNKLDEVLGWPRLVNASHGWVVRIVWGPDNMAMGQRHPPYLMANLSGGNGSIWFTFGLPWGGFTLQDVQGGWREGFHNLGNRSLRHHMLALRNYAGQLGRVVQLDSYTLNILARVAKYWRAFIPGIQTVGDVLNRLPAEALTHQIDPDTPPLGEVLKNLPDGPDTVIDI